jgi:glycosyltransferase involved in cell wall biosynthesis
MAWLKVCIVTSYPPNRARLSEYAQNLVSALADKPTIERLYLLADKSQFKQEFLPEGGKIQVLRIWKPDDLPSILAVAKKILEIKPDIVHFNVSFQSFGNGKVINATGLSLILFCRLFGFRVLASVHNLAEASDLKEFHVKPSLINHVGIVAATKIILSAQTVVVLVRSYGEFLRKRYGYKRVRYIPHGTKIDVERNTNSYEKVILFFGHMAPHKGLPVLLEAFEMLLQEKNSVKLLVAGSNHPNFPNYLDQFVQMKKENVEFVGYVSSEKLADIFRKADVVVLPYRAVPGTSGVFHLACGFGRPIVSSNLPEIRELVKYGASAVLFPPNDVNALKDAIILVLSDKVLAAKIVEQNLKFAQKETWDLVAEAYEQAYLALLNHPKTWEMFNSSTS